MVSNNNTSFALSEAGVCMIVACIIEAFQGIGLDNLSGDVGISKDGAKSIQKDIQSALSGDAMRRCRRLESDIFLLELDRAEVRSLDLILEEVCKELNDSDFEIRTWGNKAQARAVQQILRRALAE